MNVIPPAIGILPDRFELSSRGGDGTIRISARPDAAWTVKNNPAWVTVADGSGGSGDGTVPFRVAPNTSPQERTGTLEIGDATFEIVQAGHVCVRPIPGATGTATSKKTGR